MILIAGLAMSVCAVEPLRWGHVESDLTPDPEILFGELENGVRYAILPNNEPPERLSLRLVVAAGSFMEEEDQRGLAHFLEHMAFKGTEHFAADEMVEYFQRLGMAFGAHTNAHTSFDETVYKLEMSDVREEMLEDGLLLMRDYVDRMLLLEEEIEPERGVILSEKRDRDSARYRTLVAELEFLTPDSLLSERLPIGTDEAIRNVPRERFVDFHEQWYTADRIAVVAVGDVDPDSLAERIARHFESVAPNPNPVEDPKIGTLPQRGVDARIHREAEAPVARVSIQTAHPVEPVPDTAEERGRRMVLDLAHAMLSRRLELAAREPGAPFTNAVAESSEWYDFMRNSYVEAETEPEKWGVTLERLERELRVALRHGFTGSEWRIAVANMRNRYEEAVLQRATRRSRGLADSLARSVRRGRVFTSPEDDLELLESVLEAADPDAAHAAFAALWGEAERLIFLSGDYPPDEPTREELYRRFAESVLRPVEAPEEEAETEFAYREWGEPGRIVGREEFEDLEITRVRFENNVEVLLKATPFEDNTIRVGFRFGGGELELPEGRAGLAIIAPDVFINGGLEAHSKDEIERLFAGLSVDMGLSVERDAFILSGRTSPRDLDAQLNLLTAYLTAPSYRPAALERARRNVRNFYVQLRTTPEGVLRDRVARLVGGGDERFGFPALESVLALEIEDVASWMAEPLDAAALGVAIVGDVDVDAAIASLARTVGALPERSARHEAFRERRRIDFPPAETDHRFSFETEIPRALSTVIWPTDDMSDIHRTRRLGLLASIVRDRMRIRLRQELGEAYSPYAFHEASDVYEDFGYLQALSLCDPGHVDLIVENLRDIARALQEEGVDEDEFVRAREPMLTSLAEWVRNNQYWMGSVLIPGLVHPERFEWARNMREDIESITADEIEGLVREYLDPDRGIGIRIYPEPVETGKVGSESESEHESDG